MKRNAIVVASVAAGVALAAGSFQLGRSVGRGGPASAAAAPPSAASNAREVLYWQDPMVPGPRFDKPGKSPFMDMQLVPVYADQATGSGVKVAAAVQQSLGIRTAVARREDVSSSFAAIGAVQFDERLGVAVQTRVPGYVEHLAVRAPMERVRPGQALATVFAPDWLAPQNELLALERAGASRELVDAARDRLRAMSVPDELVRRSEQAGNAQARYTLTSPIGGIVAELNVRDGAAVAPGTTLFRIAGLDKVWAVAEIPEAQAVHLDRGAKVRATVQADATRTFDGALDEILPQVNPGTRTLQARFEVDNRAGRLTPGMLLRLQVAGPASSRLVVPAEALVRTGTRTLVIVRRSDGSFEPRDVRPGADLGDRVEVSSGLEDGDSVVASGQFLIDSEANLRSVAASLADAPASAASSTDRPHAGGAK